MSTTTSGATPFQQRTFKQPQVRLLKVTAKTKGSYAFEAFVFEKDKLRHFEIRFLPNRPYFAVNFFTPEPPLSPEDEEVMIAGKVIEDVVMRHRPEWTGKISISELTFSFIGLLINNETIKIPNASLKEIQSEISRIFLNTDIVKNDKKGRPYFSNVSYGKFWLTDLGVIEEKDYERYNLSMK
jgi:hypothetical protein